MDLPTFLIESLKVNGSVLSAWAWPAAFLGCAVIFKREVRALLGRIKSLKGAGMEAAFEERLEVLEEAPRERPRLEPNPISNADEGAPDYSTGHKNGEADIAPVPDGETSASQTRSDHAPDVRPQGGDTRTSWEKWWDDYNNDPVVRNDAPTGAILRYWKGVEAAIRSLYEVALSKLAGIDNPRRLTDRTMLHALQFHGVVDEPLVFRIQELRALRNLAVHDVTELSWDQVERYKKQARYVQYALAYIHSQYSPPEIDSVDGASSAPGTASRDST